MEEDFPLPQGDDLKAYRQHQLKRLVDDPSCLDARVELVCADCLICEENAHNMQAYWTNAPFCREIVLNIDSLIDGGHADIAANVCQRAASTLFNHPRLKLRLLEAQKEAIAEGSDKEAAEDADLGVHPLCSTISEMGLNIIAADQGRLEDIHDSSSRMLNDPVEWTSEFEDVIDDAQAKVYAELADHPRGMGFCFAYWHTLARVLRQDYNISWRSPAEMNPGVHFD